MMAVIDRALPGLRERQWGALAIEAARRAGLDRTDVESLRRSLEDAWASAHTERAAARRARQPRFRPGQPVRLRDGDGTIMTVERYYGRLVPPTGGGRLGQVIRRTAHEDHPRGYARGRARARRDEGARGQASRSTGPTIAAPDRARPYPRRMLIRHLALALPLALAACASDLESSVSSDIRCEPWCDPDDSYLETLRSTYAYGWSIFPDATASDQSCADLGPEWDCVVTFVSPTNPCGTLAVECLGSPLPGRPLHCNWSNPYNCP